MELQWILGARDAFAAVYGKEKGSSVCNAVMPGILADFRRTARKRAEGERLREEYLTDDKRRVAVTVTGERRGAHSLITCIEINGKPVPLPPAGLEI